MTLEEIQQHIDEVIKFSKTAGDAIMKVYESDDFDTSKKGDDSPVTKADIASNDVLCAGLKSQTPDIPILSEENKIIDYDTRKNWTYCWIVDPLDGTKEFIKRNGEFTTNVALVLNGEPIAGVVFAPVKNEMYYAIKGVGAFLQKAGESKKLTVSSYDKDNDTVRIVCSRSHLNDDTQNFVDSFSKTELVAKGSSLKFLSIANGEADVYPRLAPTMEWDTAAAHVILSEAGGSVIHAETKKELTYNKANLLNPHFIAAGKQS